jgi:cytochrome c-type biogenesis protein
LKCLIPKHIRLLLAGFLLPLLIETSVASNLVTVKFFYTDPSEDPRYCATCPAWQAFYRDFLDKNTTMTKIMKDYQQVMFEWIDTTTEAGMAEKQSYGLTAPNSLLINNRTKIEGAFNETYIREAIDAAITETSPPPPPTKPLLPILTSAFLFGIFESFSPCLIALLSFILGYTLGETTRSKENFAQVMKFGLGFTLSALTLGLVTGLLFISLQPFQSLLAWATCVLVLVFALNLLGFLKTPHETKPLLQKLTKKYVFTVGGLVLLGFLFYFLDPCIAPIFFATLPLLSSETFPIILAIFCLGVILPFFLIGLLAGSISKLTRLTYKHKSKIRAASGLILIVYVLYVMFFYLL